MLIGVLGLRGWVGDVRVVDEDINVFEFLGEVSNKGIHLLWYTDVQLDREHFDALCEPSNLPGQFPERVFSSGGENEFQVSWLCAGEFNRSCFANARRCTGNYYGLAL